MSQCHVDESALQECQAGFDKLAKLLKQIHDDNIAYRQRAEQRNREIAAWEDAKRQEDQKREAGRTAPPGYVWMPGNYLHHCK